MDMFVKKDINMVGFFWVTWNNGGVAIINLVLAEYYKKTRPPFAHAPNRLFEVDAKYWKDLREAQFNVKEDREKYLADPKGFANIWLSKMSDSNPHIKLLKYEVELIGKDLEKTDLGASEKENLIRRIDATIRSLRMWCGDPPANDRATPPPGIENEETRETKEEKEKKEKKEKNNNSPPKNTGNDGLHEVQGREEGK
jgi:hypothetical protein